MKFRLRKEDELEYGQHKVRYIIECKAFLTPWSYCTLTADEDYARQLLDIYRHPKEYGLIRKGTDLLYSNEVIG